MLIQSTNDRFSIAQSNIRSPESSFQSDFSVGCRTWFQASRIWTNPNTLSTQVTDWIAPNWLKLGSARREPATGSSYRRGRSRNGDSVRCKREPRGWRGEEKNRGWFAMWMAVIVFFFRPRRESSRLGWFSMVFFSTWAARFLLGSHVVFTWPYRVW